MLFTKNSRKLPFSKDRKSFTWKCSDSFFSKEAMCAKVIAEF